MYTGKSNNRSIRGETGNGSIGRIPIRPAYRKRVDNGCIQAKAITGVYEETSNGLIGERLIRPVYREIVDVGCLEEKADNGRIQREEMSDL